MAGVATTILIDGTPTNGSDPWIDSLVSGGAWTDADGGTVTIQWVAFQGTMDGQNSYAWSSIALNALREAMSLWESVANIDFVEVQDVANADAKFWWGTQGQVGGSDVLGWSDLPGYSESEVLDVLFNAQDSALSNLYAGGLGLVTMVHEIGHLLGLAHPHDGGAAWDATTFPGVDWFDAYEYGDGGLNQGIFTTMGYNFGWPVKMPGHHDEAYGLQSGPMALDIAAIQAIYGANTTYASGDNVYSMPRTNGAGTSWSTIWDTGGIDTISNASSIYDVTIDLRPATEGAGGGGNVSFVSGSTMIAGGYTIARGVVVENAIGGTGHDKLIGNAAINRLEGGQGDDTLDGGAGADTMIGGVGHDTYYVDDARDVVVENDDSYYVDTVYSSTANYTLRANVETLILTGGAAINGKGNSAANTIYGNFGNNILESGGGADHLYGEYGDDRLILTDMAFARADGGEGIDTLALGGASAALDLSLPKVALKIHGIERIDLTGTGNNTLTVSRASLVEGIGEAVDGQYILVVEGNAGDRLWFDEEGWTKTGSFTDAGGTFDRWEFGYTIVHVEQGVSVQQKPAAASLALSALDGSNGFKLAGGPTDQHVGGSIASAGDVNGDGFDDVIVGAWGSDAGASDNGASYVIFGKASGFASSIDLASLNGTTGFKLSGAAARDFSGVSVASAGDVNGDGFADLIVGATGADPHGDYSGASYVVFGKASGFAANLSLSALNGSDGFRLSGTAARDFSGASVASAGDFNNDGYDDLIIGAYGAKPPGSTEEVGAVYIVYGKASGFSANIDLSTLNGTTGFKLAGVPEDEMTGATVASAGDINGDGYDDVVVGAHLADNWAGATYVVFGRAAGGAASFDLGTVNGTNGFRLSGVTTLDEAGHSVASAGDVNGDGFADLIVGAYRANSNGEYSGASYVVFGKASGFAADFKLATLNGTNGFRLTGVLEGDHSGISVASAGDVNGDGFADLIVGAAQADLGGLDSGASYVVFGKASGFAASIDLGSLDGTTGLRIDGESGRSGGSVASAGDVNGDGYDDLVVGALQAGTGGAGYVVFGGAFGASATPITTIGTAAAEILMGGLGNDVLRGGGGGDVFHAGAGNDRLTVKDLAFRLADGGAGTDTLVLGGAGLSLDLSNLLVSTKLEGIERIDLSGSGNNTLIVNQLSVLGGIGAVVGGKHVLVVEGNIGDQVQFVESTWTKAGSFTNADGTFDRWVLGNAEVHVEQFWLVPLIGATIAGTAGNDVISTMVSVPGQPLATDLADTIDGAAGDDVLEGGDGNDALYGGADNDTLIGGAAAAGGTNQLWGGTGSDTASYAGTAGAVHADLAAQTGSVGGILVDQMNSVENLTGGSGDDVLVGDGGNNLLSGGAGNDGLYGQGGDDVLIGGASAAGGTNQLWGGTGNDTASYAGTTGAVHADLGAQMTYVDGVLVDQMDSIENLIGGSGDDVLTGDAGANVLAGKLGNDTYVIGAGDTIVEAAGEGTDTVRASIDYTLGANLENLVLTGAANLAGTGNGLANVLTGNAGNNLLDGGAGADTMAGGLGDDTYVMGVSDVVIEAAGEGVDTVRSSISCTLTANVERLVLTGSATINGTGNALANVLTGNDGINVLDGGAGADTMAGGLGNDSYVVDDAGDLVIEAADEGSDTVRASVSYTLGANVEKLTLQGTANLNGTGNALVNTLTGNAGNNLLEGGLGADTMIGGLGNDTYVVDDAGDVLSEALDGGLDTVRSSVSYRLRANIENLTLTGSASIDGTGNELVNVLLGNAGNNVLDGGLGADTMTGGLGDDTYVLDVSTDKITELAGQGVDTVQTTFTHVLRTNFENLTLLGAAAISAVGNAVDNVLTGNVAANVLDGAAGADTMAGGRGNDTYVVENAGDLVIEQAGEGTDAVRAWIDYTLTANVEKLTLQGTANLNGTGNELANTLVGTAGNNILDGGLGGDTMTGGAGDDTYIIDNAADRASEDAGGGFDTLLSSVTYMLRANAEKLVLTGADNINAVGNTQGNILTGTAGNNILDGGAGADEMTGGAGNDTYVVENAGDMVIEAADGGTDAVRSWIDYTLAANVEKLSLYGTANINGTGNDLANSLLGNSGRNILDGGLGADTLTGNGGGDTFRFSTALGDGNVDRITAFDHAADTIQLDDAIFASLGTGALAVGAFNTGTVATEADDRILFDAASKSLSYDADGVGGEAAVKFATIATLTGTLDHTDFFVV